MSKSITHRESVIQMGVRTVYYHHMKPHHLCGLYCSAIWVYIIQNRVLIHAQFLPGFKPTFYPIESLFLVGFFANHETTREDQKMMWIDSIMKWRGFNCGNNWSESIEKRST
jgi:hypothetical protein